MLAKIHTVALQGLQVTPIDVQVQISNGLPAFTIVGLPDKAVGESRERIRSALQSIGLSLPPKRITVNLAPADVQKEGSHYDLPIVIALLGAMEVLSMDEVESHLALGELELDGGIRRVAGVLPTALQALEKNMVLICPSENASEAAWVEGLQIIACPDLLALMNHLKGKQMLSPPVPSIAERATFTKDLSDIKGQSLAKRALEIAAAGGHNLLMMGPPGAGKSMLAERLPTILPTLEPEEALELTCIYSVAGLLPDGKLLRERPFRNPHHSASLVALVGGGAKAKPGEISLAHKGILFLDELPEFARPTLESLRQPMENGMTLIARANAHVTYPSRFQLIAAMNPCRCGYMGTVEAKCRTSDRCGEVYQNRISGPIFDRMDMHVSVAAIKPADLATSTRGETSATVLERVQAARALQKNRYKALKLLTNAELSSKQVDDYAKVTEAAKQMLLEAAEKYRLSARSYYRTLKVARTIADLANAPEILRPHVAEALGYRKG